MIYLIWIFKKMIILNKIKIKIKKNYLIFLQIHNKMIQNKMKQIKMLYRIYIKIRVNKITQIFLIFK